ncbi:hypothetical protein Y695_04496 [Hydrogenophaga sp. T4]|nr:hypothetical protein Y695_04496 [Hydrogenophaga sp. T4]
MFERGVAGRVKAVVHAGGEPQCHVAAALQLPRQLAALHVVAQQVEQPVGEALGLEQLGVCAVLQGLDAAAGADDAVARAGQHTGTRVNRAQAGLEFADEAVVQAVKVRLSGFAQIEVGKSFPDRHRRVTHPGVADAAPPAHEARERDARHAVGQQEIQVFVQRQALSGGSQVHTGVMGVK